MAGNLTQGEMAEPIGGSAVWFSNLELGVPTTEGDRHVGVNGIARSARVLQGAVSHVAVESLLPADSPRSGGIDEAHAALLAECDAGLPPIVVHRPTMRVIDGMHRLRAAVRKGQREIAVRFFDGDEAEAFVLAVELNIAHGLPLSLADRKAAARKILAAGAGWSDRAVAAKTGLSDKTVVSGTGAFTVPITPSTSFTAQAGAAGIFLFFAVPQSDISFDGTTATITYPVTGGDAQVSDLSGDVTYGDSLKFTNIKTHKSVTLSTLTFDMSNAQFDGTSSVDGSQQPIFDTVGTVVTSQNGSTQTYSADSLKIGATGASYLNTVLNTKFFRAGKVVGSFSTSYTY